MSGPAWVFVTPTLSRPTGGDIALVELVNALSQQVTGGVRLVHVPFHGVRTQRVDDLPWARFDPSVEHTFAESLDPRVLAPGEVVVYTMKLVASVLADPAAGADLLEALEQDDPASLAILFLQGQGVFGEAVEERALRLPGPKVCVSTWLTDLAVSAGVAPDQVACIPNGVDPDTFRIRHPIAGRPPSVAMNYDAHPVKRGADGLKALGAIHRALGVPTTAFGTQPPSSPPPDGVRFVTSPARPALVDEIYNASASFLQPSQREGFGMCAVEAMACGCALVTTDNGGSDDYAYHEETALVCGPDPAEMADALARLAGDDALRVRLAKAGARHVERFRWEASAQALAQFADERLAARQ